jgi:uncharacterized iron-regulated membrane protein
MEEAFLRKWHRFLGIILALFIFAQAATGTLLALQSTLHFPDPFGVLEELHTGGGLAGNIYRILLGLGLTVMAFTGALIYFKIRARTKKKKT